MMFSSAGGKISLVGGSLFNLKFSSLEGPLSPTEVTPTLIIVPLIDAQSTVIGKKSTSIDGY